MNVVGKVSSLISQGVFSVATPFHPFGGAVDIVVVEQSDGTFKSTPWYIRFGKFQGVLKGTEKVVRIEVNGVEANFSMYLDNSGEAYFLREVDRGQDGCECFKKESDSLEECMEDNNDDCGNIDSCLQESDILNQDATAFRNDDVEVRDERLTLGMDPLDRVESECGGIFCELQDDKKSLEGSHEYSEYDGSSRTHDNLDSVQHALESQDSNSEVLLVSVDGHIITAPLSSSGRKDEDVEPSAPHFYVHPAEGTAKYIRAEDTSTGDCLNEPEVITENICKGNSETLPSEHELEPYVGNGEHRDSRQDFQVSDDQEKEHCAGTRSDVFMSCLELEKLGEQSPAENQENVNSSVNSPETTEDSKENSYLSPSTDKTVESNLEILRDNDKLSPHDSGKPISVSSSQVEAATHSRNASDMDNDGAGNVPAQYVSNDEELLQQVNIDPTTKIVHSNGEVPDSDANNENEHVEPENDALLKNFNSEIFTRLEISLCGHLLHAGMGLSAAQEVFDANRIPVEEFKLAARLIVKNGNLIVRTEGQYIPWCKAEHVILGKAACGLDLPIEPHDVIPVEQGTEKTKEGNPTPSRAWSLWSIPFRRLKTHDTGQNDSSNGHMLVDPDSASNSQHWIPTPTARAFTDSPRKQIIRTNVPTTDEIVSLNLKEGQNMVNFVFSTRVFGSQKVDAHIYLWKWNTRIVISDVDGTITKSDVLGQFMPLVGKDWTHSGITCLFSAIKENGYQLLFLSARAIVQSNVTKSFLFNLKQDGKSLPVGPVVISPDGLFPSLYREVIRRAPHEFKIACLEDIKALFPPDHNPFYAGFGNRDTDELSYRKIGIPKGKIFIINPKGEVAINHRIDVKSYTSLHTLVHDMFPPTPQLEQEDYNSWNYWKMPVPDIDKL